jgi:hypothetical protein
MSAEAPIEPSTRPPPASRDAAPRALAPTSPADATPPAASDAAAAAHAPTEFPFSLQFDPDTHRLMIESRDPFTGFIVFQVPPKTAIRAIEASSAAAARGERVDREA